MFHLRVPGGAAASAIAVYFSSHSAKGYPPYTADYESAKASIRRTSPPKRTQSRARPQWRGVGHQIRLGRISSSSHQSDPMAEQTDWMHAILPVTSVSRSRQSHRNGPVKPTIGVVALASAPGTRMKVLHPRPDGRSVVYCSAVRDV